MSMGGARSTEGGLDEICDCDPCRSEGRQREAEYYCRQCQEFLCSWYKDHHKKFKMSRDHKVAKIFKPEERSVAGASNVVHECKPCKCDGKRQEANYYNCEQCKEYLCSSSRQLLRIKVTPDLHLTYSKNGGNLGLVLKMKNIACISILLIKHVIFTYLYLFKFVLYSILAFKAN